LIKIIIRRFIRNHQNVNDKFVREAYGVLGGALGVICNLLLFSLKLSIGLFINSIAVVTDAFNNLTDTGSSVVSILGAKLSNRPPDREHPYGHGRFEYIASLVVAFIIFSVGLQLLRNSFDKILYPEEVVFSPISIVILCLSILVKLWMYSYNWYIGNIINSGINRAVAYDSLSDIVATGAVIIGTILGRYIRYPVDGLLGLVISFLILYTGFSIAKDTVNLLLGASADPELADTINSLVAQGKYIVGIHALRMHDYGPGRVIASIHAEVPDDVNIVKVHSIIDEMEEKISDELGIDIIIHMDPISTDIDRNNQIKALVIKLIEEEESGFSAENLRIIDGEKRISVIFDLLVPSSIVESEFDKINRSITDRVIKENNKIKIVINSIRVKEY